MICDVMWCYVVWCDVMWYMIYDMWYDMMIYLLTAFGLSPGGSTLLHTNNTQNNTNNNRTTQITNNVEDCWLFPISASYTLAFALQLRRNHRKTSIRVRKTSVRLRKTCQSTVYTLPKHPHKHTHYKTHSYTHTRIHTLQNNIKPPQYKIHPNETVTIQGGQEVTVHPDNTHLRLNISLHCTAQHAVQCKMAGWQQCAR
jgi:hypothetical protein